MLLIVTDGFTYSSFVVIGARRLYQDVRAFLIIGDYLVIFRIRFYYHFAVKVSSAISRTILEFKKKKNKNPNKELQLELLVVKIALRSRIYLTFPNYSLSCLTKMKTLHRLMPEGSSGPIQKG